MDKAPDAFRTISEVSEWLDTPTYVLRFWESRFPQIKPVKRAGGRRYYRPEDMQLLGGIKKLLHFEGNTIKNVQGIIKESGTRHVADMSPDLNENVVSPRTVKQKDASADVESLVILKGELPPSVLAAEQRHISDPLKLTDSDKSEARILADARKRAAAGKDAVPAAGARDLAGAEATLPQAEEEAMVAPGPFAVRPARTYSAEDLQEIETLYYSLKMVRNNIRRAGKRG